MMKRNLELNIKSFFLSFIKKYFSSYAGIPIPCWQGLSLGFIEATITGISFFLSIYFVKTLHFSIAASGVILSFYGLGRVLGGLLSGKVSDKMSPGIVSISSLIIQASAYFLLIKLTAFYLILSDMFILGIATYGFITANTVWVVNQCQHLEDAKLKTLSILHASSNLGISVSALLVGWLSDYGYKNIFEFAGIVLLCAAAYSYFIERKINGFKLRARNSVNDNTKKSIANKKQIQLVWLVLTCLFFIGLIIAQLGTTYSIYIHDKFSVYGMRGVSMLFALNSILIVIFQTPLVNYFNKFNKVMMVGIGAFLMGFGMFMLSFSFVFAMAILACVIYTIGEMLFFSIAQFVCYENSDKNKRSSSLGMFRAVFAASVFVGPATGGFIYHHLGADLVWYICGIIGISCLMACSYFRKYEVKSSAEG